MHATKQTTPIMNALCLICRQSGKATLLNTLLETIIEKGEKVLIFTQVGRPRLLSFK